jgi:ribonuclease HI
MEKPKSNNFVISISEEKKRIKDLKYTVYVKGNSKSYKGCWYSLIVNNKGEKVTLKGDSNNTNTDRMELIAINESIKSILLNSNPNDYKFIKIQIYTESIYCTNIIKEWMNMWKRERFINRPNSDILQELNINIEKCIISIYYLMYSTLTNHSIYGSIVTELNQNTEL